MTIEPRLIGYERLSELARDCQGGVEAELLGHAAALEQALFSAVRVIAWLSSKKDANDSD